MDSKITRTRIKNIEKNIDVAFKTIHKHRNKRIVLVGAWMGTKFADNSRYLYQYLFANKKKLGLKKVIWITRNKDVNELLILRTLKWRDSSVL